MTFNFTGENRAHFYHRTDRLRTNRFGTQDTRAASIKQETTTHFKF